MKKRILFASCILVILVVSILASTGGRLKTSVVRETWEYKVVGIRLDDMAGDKEGKLNRLGAEGWELVTSAHHDDGGTSVYDFYLKRRK